MICVYRRFRKFERNVKIICGIVIFFILLQTWLSGSKFDNRQKTFKFEREISIESEEKIDSSQKTDFPDEKLRILQALPPPIAQYRKDRYEGRNRPDNRPGSLGKAYELNLTGAEAKRENNILHKMHFNVLVNKEVPLYRTLPDARLRECQGRHYNLSALPIASVVMPFHNEDFRILMRTVHSVVNRSPPQLLKEVILVDDYSDLEELTGSKLDDYIKKEWPDGAVKVVHLEKESGLLTARMRGAELATGEVVILMKSQSETTEGWLEPLLQRIKDKRSAVLYPVLGHISGKDMSVFFDKSSHMFIGSFKWDLEFDWYQHPRREVKRVKSKAFPVPYFSPTMLSDVIAADRKFFFEIGGLDTEMNDLGGDNIELAFRTWMCGGSVEIVTCSFVARLWRWFTPPNQSWEIANKNYVRIAESLMGDYKRLYYLHRPLETPEMGGDVSSKLELLKKLNCKSFRWFLDNVYPEKYIYDDHSLGYGTVKNEVAGVSLCLDLLDSPDRAVPSVNLGLATCKDKPDVKQLYSYSLWNELRRDKTCAQPHLDIRTTDTSPVKVVLFLCTRQANDVPPKARETWQYDPKTGQLKVPSFNKCLTTRQLESGKDALLTNCDADDPHQVWKFQFWRPGNPASHNVTFPPPVGHSSSQ